MPRKPIKRKNICATCKYFQSYVITDAYGKKYQTALCNNVKSDRDKTWRSRNACRCWSKKTQPASGDWCSFIQNKIIYTDKTPKTSLPCFKCNARCVFAFNKKERDFTNHRRQGKTLIEDLMTITEKKND